MHVQLLSGLHTSNLHLPPPSSLPSLLALLPLTPDHIPSLLSFPTPSSSPASLTSAVSSNNHASSFLPLPSRRLPSHLNPCHPSPDAASTNINPSQNMYTNTTGSQSRRFVESGDEEALS